MQSRRRRRLVAHLMRLELKTLLAAWLARSTSFSLPPLSLCSSPPLLSLCLSGQIANATQTIALLSIDKSAMYMGNVCSQIRRFYQPLFFAFVFCFFFSSPASSFTSPLACAWLSYCCCCYCCCCCWWESARARPDLRQTSCAACFA